MHYCNDITVMKFVNALLVARRKERLEEVAASCKKLGATDVLVLSKDLLDLDSCSQVGNETVAEFGSEFC